ncbi:AMP-binding protein, partial [Salmonella sp. SAL04269]|uniref:AMP-binding protein n=1 Tax=Salmonella sp. SAL04269 TaxID=3159847 RepID=UPI00397D1F0D
YGEGRPVGELDYEALLAEGDPQFAWEWPRDEWQAISLNYTSGTTGKPKGVCHSHRGLIGAAMHGCEFDRLGPDDDVLSYLP